MYRTNLPKEAMAFPGSPFPSAIQHSFLNHQEVLGYLESFAKQNNMHEKIKVSNILIASTY